MRKLLFLFYILLAMFVLACDGNEELEFVDTISESAYIKSSKSPKTRAFSLDESVAIIQSLEKQYGVEITYPNNVVLSAEDIVEIENKILEIKSIFNISVDSVPLEKLFFTNIKTRSIESMTVETWAFNTTKLKVAVSIDNDTSCLIESWCTGASIYDTFTQKGVYHDFEARQNQKRINFGFTLVATSSVSEVNMTVDTKVTGWVDFASSTGSLTCGD